ncbi:type II toxin-antitoxin system VapB family antitoxin [Mesorhizobium sp. M0030]|uniref:type II toxin-antitoxin system VapB family antitoxin n=1 Tax=Mesorhizobium sp. M0030 TaxID=2956851 RepID=UPI003334E3E6
MNLQIRDPRARDLARQLAEKRKISMTEAVIEALESELQRERERVPLAERRLAAISNDLKAKAGSGGRDLTKDEIDEMWGHS